MSKDDIPEIEITPEMIEAGAAILDVDTAQDLMEGWARPREVAEAVYLAMRQLAVATPSVRREQ
jgi:hypothetical protein